MDGPCFYAIDVNRVNIDDLIYTHRPGAIVRVEGDPGSAIVRIPCASVFGQTWKCGHCESLMAWKLSTVPPRKCTSCGAPRSA